MNNLAKSSEQKAASIQRIALQLSQPGMILAREVYDEDGNIMVAAGAELTGQMILRLKTRGILSAFVRNPLITLPEISPEVQEVTRNKARLMVEHAFNVIRRAEQFSMSAEDQLVVLTVVETVTQDPLTVVHLAHIHRNSHDIMAHSVNVALLSTAAALAMGINKPAILHELALCALLHDIGLLMVPQDLFSRRDSLNPDEILIYREHTNWGFAILKQTDELPASVALVAQQHHEHADGTGYPLQLTNTSLHPYSRIIAAINAYDNFCASFAERRGCQAHLAYESVMSGAGSRFDLNVSKALLTRLPMYTQGSLVKLTNGLVGVVLSSSPDMPHRPKLKILGDSDGQALKETYLLNLTDLENQTLFVSDVLDDEAVGKISTGHA